jgi:hypothetical protein
MSRIDYTKLIKRVAQELRMDTWEDLGVSENLETFDELKEPVSDEFKAAFDYYVDLVAQNMDYTSIVYELKNQFGDDLAVKVLEHAVENDALDFGTNVTAQQNVTTFFLISDGVDTKVVREDVFEQNQMIIFEHGFDVLARLFDDSPLAMQEGYEPNEDDPRWEPLPSAEKDDNWVLI